MNNDFFIDTHCHLGHMQDIETVIHDMRKNHVLQLIVPAVHIEDSKNNIELFKKFSCCHVAVGIHPQYAVHPFPYDDFLTLVTQQEVCAIGEIGLDDSVSIPYEIQEENFIIQLDIAKQFHKPVLIHSRHYFGKLVEIIKNFLPFPESGILHSYSGSYELAKQLPFYIGVSGAITQPKAIKRRHILQQFSLNRIVLETDSPYMSTKTISSQHTTPSQIPEIAETVAMLYNTTIENIATITTNNALSIFHNFTAC